MKNGKEGKNKIKNLPAFTYTFNISGQTRYRV